jgi:hypothetical protein
VDSALPVRGLDPHHGWTAGPTVAGDMAAWLVTDTDRWAPAVRAGEALALVERAVQTVRTDPAGRELAGTVEQLRLVHPVLGDIGALRAEAAGELGLPADAVRAGRHDPRPGCRWGRARGPLRPLAAPRQQRPGPVPVALGRRGRGPGLRPSGRRDRSQRPMRNCRLLRPSWMRDLTVPTGTSSASAISA